MSEPLVVSIPHCLGNDEALRRLKTGLAEIGTSFGHVFRVREQTWTGDRLHFQVSALGPGGERFNRCSRGPRAAAVDSKGRNVVVG